MNRFFSYILLFFLALVLSVFVVGAGTSMAVDSHVETVYIERDDISPPTEDVESKSYREDSSRGYEVQAVLSAGKGLLVSAPIDGMLKKLPFENGDKFKKNDILVRYDCTAEKAKVTELRARLSMSKRQVEAYERLKEADMVADVEYVSVIGQNKQDRALLTQAQSRLDFCVIKAPFSGRVQDLQVDVNEVVKSGRFLMKINSDEPLNVEMLVPSTWLRWLNVGADLQVYIRESDRTYDAEVVRIHGEVDPVSQSIRIVAKISQYEEELLPGMSGKATFEKTSRQISGGFMGLSTSVYNKQ